MHAGGPAFRFRSVLLPIRSGQDRALRARSGRRGRTGGSRALGWSADAPPPRRPASLARRTLILLAAVSWSSLPRAVLLPSDTQAILAIGAALLVSAFLGALRAALRFSHAQRLSDRALSERAQARLGRLLERAEALSRSASILKITCDLVFVTLLVGLFAQDQPLRWSDLALALAVGAPVLLLFTEALASSIGHHRAGDLLVYVLPVFHVLQTPLGLLVASLTGLERMFLRLLHIPARPPAVERIVEDLRGVIEDSAIEEPLGAAQRELIENVVALADVAVAAIMTPRTEIHGIEVEEPLETAVRVFAEHGHSRVPIYRDTIDAIIGTIHALDLTRALAAAPAERPSLREIMRPAYFVPDTKRVSELLSELRTKKRKMAIVLDEYGGTAGVVTLTDLLAEIVGEIQGEHQDKSERIVRQSDGSVEVEAGLHVSEVNEALGLSIPEEEDFETLGGFVLAELGRFPRAGEHFRHGNAEFSVVEASDRRVLKVGVRKSA